MKTLRITENGTATMTDLYDVNTDTGIMFPISQDIGSNMRVFFDGTLSHSGNKVNIKATHLCDNLLNQERGMILTFPIYGDAYIVGWDKDENLPFGIDQDQFDYLNSMLSNELVA